VVPLRWARFRSHDGRQGFGTVEEGLLAEFEGDPFAAPRATGRTLPPGSYKLLAPCTPSKMVALWNNFGALAAKLGKQPPQHPLFLIKPGTCIIGPDQPIRRPTGYAGKIAYEGELGIVIGRRCRDVPVQAAAEVIFGYTCVNDVTATDVLNETPDFAQWCRSKAYDTFGCIGPVIATAIDLAQARIVTRLGEVERQNFPLSDMLMAPTLLVSLISHDMTLLPGDVIACGTSVGVGSIRDGAGVEVSIDGIGSLSNMLEPAGGVPPRP
jgi:2-keto-4-pentenoate hydratase/2-oxohepta-3-ene-1,7-dioic acid hydratase in catechol pathway